MSEHSVGAAAAVSEPTFEPIRRRRGRGKKRPSGGGKRQRRMQRAARAAQRDELARLAAAGLEPIIMEAGS